MNINKTVTKCFKRTVSNQTGKEDSWGSAY